MQRAYEIISEYFDLIVQYLILLVEAVGIAVLVFAIVRAVIGIFKKVPHVRLNLAEGIALSLEFKIGSELLRSVVVREWSEVLMLGAIILLRAALTFLIQWEIKLERKSGVPDITRLKGKISSAKIPEKVNKDVRAAQAEQAVTDDEQ